MSSLAEWVEAQHPRDDQGRFTAGQMDAALHKWAHAQLQGPPLTASEKAYRERRAATADEKLYPEMPPHLAAAMPSVKAPEEAWNAYYKVLEAGELKPGMFHAREDKDGRVDAATAVAGINHPGLAKWLSAPGNAPSLEMVHDLAEATGHPGVVGQYFETTGEYKPSIYVDGNASPPLTPASERESWGETWNVTARTNSNTFAVQTNFAHELGHHIHLAKLSREPDFSGKNVDSKVAEVVFKAYEKNGLSKATPGDDGKPPLKERILKHEPGTKNPAISRYAATSYKEYFAESFAAYVMHPTALKKHDPVGYDMVKNVLRLRGIE